MAIVEARRVEEPPLLLCREQELAALAGALDAARQGRGSLVLIGGAAGTGKSTLLGAAVRLAQRNGLGIRRARASEFEDEVSFGIIRQLFEPSVRTAREEERARLLSGAAASAARLFDAAPAGQSGLGDGGFSTLNGLYWLAAGDAEGGYRESGQRLHE